MERTEKISLLQKLIIQRKGSQLERLQLIRPTLLTNENNLKLERSSFIIEKSDNVHNVKEKNKEIQYNKISEPPQENFVENDNNDWENENIQSSLNVPKTLNYDNEVKELNKFSQML